MSKLLIQIVLAASFLAALAGCGSGSSQPAAGNPQKPKEPSETASPEQKDSHGAKGHSHQAPHGGIINSVGNFHVELVFDTKISRIALYVLEEEERKPKPIDAESISAQAKPEENDKFVALTLMPSPLPGESAESASRFEVPAGELAKAQAFELFLRIPIGGKQSRTAFQVVPGKSAAATSNFR